MLCNMNVAKPRDCQTEMVNHVNGVKLCNVEVEGPSNLFRGPMTALVSDTHYSDGEVEGPIRL